MEPVALFHAATASLSDGNPRQAVAQIQENQKLISDGQQLVEMSLVDRLPDDGEPWRESLGDDQ
jgi:hypothetical protein